MKIAHFVYYGPKMAGLYETSREICKQELALGHDARLIDTSWYSKKPKAAPPSTSKLDRGVEVVPMSWALQADIHVLHSIIPDPLVGTKPAVVILHGAPEYVFYSELVNHDKGDRGFSTMVAYAQNRDVYKKAVTLWPRHKDFWVPIFGEDRVEVAPSCADFSDYTPEGSKLEFKTPGKLNVGFCDSWRATFQKTPFQIIPAVYRYYEQDPGVKLHLFAMPPGDKRDIVWDRYINTVKLQRPIFGDLWERYHDMASAYRALDMVITPTGDASRVIREALACGTPVIAPPDCRYTPFTADFWCPDDVCACIGEVVKALKEDPEGVRNKCVETAHREFPMGPTAEKLVAVYEDILKEEQPDAGSVEHEQAPESSDPGV